MYSRMLKSLSDNSPSKGHPRASRTISAQRHLACSFRNLQRSSRLFHKHTGQGRHNEALCERSTWWQRPLLTHRRRLYPCGHVSLALGFCCKHHSCGQSFQQAAHSLLHCDPAAIWMEQAARSKLSATESTLIWLSQYLCEFVWHGCPRVHR